MNKDIILVSSEFTQSGVYRIENLLIKEWEKRDCTISKITSRGLIIHDSFNSVEILPRQNESNLLFLRLFRRMIRLRKLLAHHQDATVVALNLPAGCFASILSLFIKNKVVISERNSPSHYPESRLYRKFRNICFTFADVCIFQTEEAKEYFSRNVQKKGVIIPNPVNDTIPVFNNIRREKKIVSTGRLRLQKNFPLLIKSFAKFCQYFDNYTLEIYGNGPLKDDLLELINQLGLSEKIILYDFCDDIFPIIAGASMFVMSSNYEGISNSMLEALAIGTPTICTDCPVGGARAMIENNVNGILVPVGDVDALADAMCRVAGDPAFAETLGSNGQKIREKYPIEKIAQQWIDVM